MRHRHHRAWLVIVAVPLVACAAGGSVANPGTSLPDPPDPIEASEPTTATASVTSTSTPVDLDGLRTGGDHTVVGALRELPDSSASEVVVTTADLVAVTESVGQRRPTTLEPVEDLVSWLSPLAGLAGTPPSTTVFVPLPDVFGPDDLTVHDEFAAELGWSLLDVEAFVARGPSPEEFTVVAGSIDDVTLPAALPEVAPGIVTAGEGEDGEVDPQSTTVARPDGRPLRMAQHDGLLAASTATAPVAAWHTGSFDSMADRPELTAVATVLDRHDVVSAVLVAGEPGTFRVSSSPQELETPGVRGNVAVDDGSVIADPFDAVGIGWTVDGHGDAAMVAAWHFPSAEAADRNTTAIETAFSERRSLQTGRAIHEDVVLRTVAAQGQVVTATLGTADGALPLHLYEMLVRRDLPFVHR